MLTAAPHSHRSSERTSEKPHCFATPVVREMPRPAPEPLGWSSCW